jgi:large subunit ribosomal protein L31
LQALKGENLSGLLRTKKYIAMKNGIHPSNYRFVVFQDMSNSTSFLSKSTAPSKETIKWEDGTEYPLIKLEISNTSHPFYTGKMKLVDTAGRVDKFNTRYKDVSKKK